MENKNILIVGASSGVGYAIGGLLGEKGANIYSISRTEPEHPSSLTYQHLNHDILEDEIPDGFLPETLDGLIYCPGSINLKPFRSLSIDVFRQDYELNVLGAVKTIKAALKPMKKSTGNPSIVLFSTVAVQQGMAFHASIAAAKGAIEGLTRSLAAELAPKIRVNCIAPSLVNTPLANNILSSDERIEASNNRHPLKRIGQPNDIAQAALFLLDKNSSWITGQVLGVDGGLSRLR
ncbi:MAG: NAD(P)-dependent dehydrogenase (short-subunit alcohol dehydrogenase family) [Saprospiraceae bacterium]|jgi:NAD(P)-dependent dehydrogenase (short-subunit alcohol dehydrogenase family)|tara:strand:+ start:1366 stop:2070 length:705 start_codon:yes stop_codon:yes gene_type:complete